MKATFKAGAQSLTCVVTKTTQGDLLLKLNSFNRQAGEFFAGEIRRFNVRGKGAPVHIKTMSGTPLGKFEGWVTSITSSQVVIYKYAPIVWEGGN
jgi:hypothetical protein